MDKPLHVLMQGFSGDIGLTYHLTKLAVGLKHQGIDVVLITTQREQEPGLKETLRENGINYYESNIINKRFWNLLAMYRGMHEISHIATSESIDIIHIHGCLFPAYLAAKLTLVGRRASIIETVNFMDLRNTMISRFIQKMANMLTKRYADIVVPVSEQLGQKLIALGFNREKIMVTHWGIDLEKFDRAKQSKKFLQKYWALLQCLKGKNVIIQSAYLYGWKGQEIMLKAAPMILQEFPETKFLFCGDGPTKKGLFSLANNLGLNDSVIFTGWVESDFIPVLLDHANIGAVLSSSETFSIAAIETMAAGKPVIMTPVGVAPEIITNNNRVGYIISHNDPNALAKAVIDLLNDPVKAKVMGSRGRKVVEEKFTINEIACRYKEVYNIALKDTDLNQESIL